MKHIITTIIILFLFSCAKKPQEVIHPETPKNVKTTKMDSERLKLESLPTDLSFDTTAAQDVETGAKGLAASPGTTPGTSAESVSPNQSSSGSATKQTASSKTASLSGVKTTDKTVATKKQRSTTKPSPKATTQKTFAGTEPGKVDSQLPGETTGVAGKTVKAAQPGEEEAVLADKFLDQRQTSFTITPEVLFPDSSFEGYMIQPGDFLIKIAKKEYGDWRKWRDIYRWNRKKIGENPNLIYPYHFLDLLKPIDQLKTCELKFYSRPVTTGESLWTIAREVYGDELAWIVLFWDNESLMKANNGVLYPGMELKIRENIDPCNPTS
ncbi:MAG: LysM peptidoglycan-binding domain-containing protein [FCB group bacterium]|nr:LysM peptidoglycan-binding domain-containing protein [FCB group bacterium]